LIPKPPQSHGLVGLFSKNTLRFININQLYNTLGATLSKSLPGYHAFTGSDYTAAFSRKGKLSALKVLEKDNKLQETFGKLGEEDINSETFEQLELLACRMYGMKKINSINEVRLEKFAQKYKPKKDKVINLKSMDGSFLPPCFAVLKEKIKRVNYVTAKWKSSTSIRMPPITPQESGWILEGNRYRLNWFDGECTPPSLDLIVQEAVEDPEASGEDEEEDNEFLRGSDDESEDEDIEE